jgi:tRNA-dihydrouridine synthase 1
MMEAAGAQIITCHGRTREMKGQFTGLADWELIKAVKEAVSIPVFANGNILYREDVDRCLELTGCDGVMSAEGNLSNPALFLPPDHPHFHPHIATLADRYLDMVDGLKTPTAMSAVRAHFFRMLKPVLDEHEHIRQMIANARTVDGSITGGFREVVQAVRELVQVSHDSLFEVPFRLTLFQTKVDEAGPGWTVPPIDPITGYRSLPNFVVQPYIRPTTVITGDEITSAVNLTEEVGETRESALLPLSHRGTR